VSKLKFVILSLLVSLAILPSARAEKVSALISDQGDTIHLELSGQQNWDYDLRRVEKAGKNYLQLTVDQIDEASLKKIQAFKSDMVRGVTVDKAGADGKYIVSFQVDDKDVESFDYLTDQPSRLIVDFFVNASKAADKKTETAKLPAKAVEKDEDSKTPPLKKVPAKTVAKTTAKKAGQRKPATTDVLVVKNDAPPKAGAVAATAETRSGLFDGGDPNFDRFSIKDYEVKDEDLIRSKENYYIPYPMIRAENHYWERMKIAAPIYEITPKDSEENKEARLLQTLFEKKRFAVYLKTEEWFRKKYPESEYNDIVDFMTADVYKTLWEEKNEQKYYEIAQVKYKQALQKHPKSPLVERTSLMLGYMALEKGDSLDAIRLFNEHIEKNYAGKADAVSNDLARMGIGTAYAKLNRYQEAAEAFTGLQKSPHQEIKAEAAYRTGDVYVQARNYQKAVDAYQAAIKDYPDYQPEYPNAFYNQAEALFGLGDYRKSLDVYLDFIKKFPSHEHAAFAMTRLGELLEILGADKSRVVGAYLETYFRYGESDNAIIARLRLTSARMKAMKPKEVDASAKEILNLVKRLDIPNIEQFGTIMISEGYTARSEPEKAIALLTKYYQQNPTTVDRDLFTKRIVANITDEIHDQVNKGEVITALKTHSKYADNWLKNNERIDTKYFLARAFEKAGAEAEAEKNYRDVLNKVYAIRGTKQDKELTVTKQKPSEDELNLRLASTTYQQKKMNQAYDYLKNIKNPEQMPEDQQIERVRLAVDLLEKRGDLDSAVRYLTELLKTWKGQAHLVAEPYLRLAQLEIKQGKPDAAIESLKKVNELMADSKNVPSTVHAQSLELLGKLYLDKGDSTAAVGVFEQLLNNYEDKRPLASIRYKLGQVYFKKGEVQKAAEVWNKLQAPKSEFWYNLAQEQLKNSEWRGDYKKYIQRIPAMSQQ
jgi:tetratricopeptide (TPR) repeat protein